MDEKNEGFFNDDGTPINPNILPKPSLCISCRHDGDPGQEKLCILNRIDQTGKEGFRCDAYERK